MTGRPPDGQAGTWRFGPVSGTRPYDLTIAAGPYVQAWQGEGGTGGAVRMSIRRRRSLDGAAPGLDRFAGLARQALEHYERTLGVPCPYPKYDIGFVPRLDATAISIPGLMLVNENLLARMADPQDDFVAMVCAHEVAHLWFGGHVGMRWWDDLWQDEAMASYLSYTVIGDAWPAFCYREKERAYAADALPGRQPVSSPVASASSGEQLEVARSWLSGATPDGVVLDGDLRGRLLRTLAARGLATEEDLDALAAADPVGGEQNLVSCRALRPDAAAKAAAWELALAEGQDRRTTEAAARGIWVPGQEAVLAGYRERYFAEAVPVLDRREIRTMRRLARALYPATLAEPATLAATAAALERGGLSEGMRQVLQEQEAILHAALAARSVPRRWF